MKHETPSRHKLVDGQISATVPRLAFTAAVKVAASSPECAERSIAPVLGCLMVGPDAIEYRGCDASIRAAFAGGEGSGRVMLPARSLVAILSAMTAEAVTLTKDATAKVVELKCGDVTARLVPLAVADAPPTIDVEAKSVVAAVPEKNVQGRHGPETVPAVPEKVVDHGLRTFALGEGVLASLLALTRPFISTEETRYYLCGVALACEAHPEGERLRAVATDGHRLGTRSVGLSAPCEPFPTRIVPCDLVGFLAAHIGSREVTVRITTSRVEFAFGAVVVSGKLVDGTYPDYARVIPAETGNTLTFESKDTVRLLLAQKRMMGRMGVAVKIETHPVGVTFTSKSPDAGELSARVAAEVAGTPCPSLGFNAGYLASVFQAFGSKRLRFQFDEPGSPCRVTDPDAPGDALAVVMPMRV